MLFPTRPFYYPLWCVWCQYHHFVHVFIDRFRLLEGEDLAIAYEGWENIVEATESGRGGIILMSHLGSWEISAQLLKYHGRNHSGMRLLLYMGEKHREQIEKRQKKSIEESGIRVVAIPEKGGSPMDILEGKNFLQEGGLVSLAGDRLWSTDQPAVTVRFAGGEARIPEIPYILSMISGAPLLIFFGYRTGKGAYQLVTMPPLYVTPASRGERRKAVEAAAQTYADLLAETVRANPFEWYHFTPFLIEKGKVEKKDEQA
jgi:predicted LPLAT superfamily acyltransferase